MSIELVHWLCNDVFDSAGNIVKLLLQEFVEAIFVQHFNSLLLIDCQIIFLDLSFLPRDAHSASAVLLS